MADSQFVVMGVDVGKTNDPTAIAVADPKGFGSDTRFLFKFIERLPLNQSYVVQVERVMEILGSLITIMEANTLAEKPHWQRLMDHERPAEYAIIMRVDITGVGRVFIDMLQEAIKKARLRRIRVVPVLFVEGQDLKVNAETGVLHMGKGYLASRLIALAQTARISVPRGEMAEILKTEMRTYSLKLRGGTKPPEIGAIEGGTNDDVITAAGLAALTDAPAPRLNAGDRGTRDRFLTHWSRQ